jgi:hypothetical protein
MNLYDIIDSRDLACTWRKRLMPAYVWETDPFTFWQERILFIICFTASFFGPFVLVPSMLLSISEGLMQMSPCPGSGCLSRRVAVLMIRTHLPANPGRPGFFMFCFPWA